MHSNSTDAKLNFWFPAVAWHQPLTWTTEGDAWAGVPDTMAIWHYHREEEWLLENTPK